MNEQYVSVRQGQCRAILWGSGFLKPSKNWLGNSLKTWTCRKAIKKGYRQLSQQYRAVENHPTLPMNSRTSYLRYHRMAGVRGTNFVEPPLGSSRTVEVFEYQSNLAASSGLALRLSPRMDTFEYYPKVKHGEVIFGNVQRNLPAELARLQLKAPLVLSTSGRVSLAEKVKEVLNGQVAGIFSEATMHTPTHVTDKAVEYAKAQGADSVISVGGGSTIGLGKAISIRTGLPHICIPTTYAGSEVTPILGETVDGIKKTRSDPKILPGTVIYDVDLTMTLPVAMCATSGVNAIAHAGKCA
jgi:hypothetical protein